MFRLTLLLVLAMGAAFLIGGRDLSPEEQAALGITPKAARAAPPAPEPVTRAATPLPVVAAPAADRLTLANTPPATVAPVAEAEPLVSEDAVAEAVELAMATDGLDSVPPEEIGGLEVIEDEPSVADEVAAALSESQVWYVNADRVNVRSGPSTQFAVVGQVALGDATEILTDPDEPWVKIRIQGDGIEGYVARRFLQDVEPNG